MIETDVFIAGAGLAGSIAALSYSKAGRNVIIADPFIHTYNTKLDYRTTAYLQPSKLFLETLGVWEAIQGNENNRFFRHSGRRRNQKPD